MKYVITYDDLFGHIGWLDEFKDLDEARAAFKVECYSPAYTYDDFVCLDVYDDEDEYIDTIDDYQYTRLDRVNED